MSVPSVCDANRDVEHVFIQDISEKDAISRDCDDLSTKHLPWCIRSICRRGEGFLSRK
jgi:hypothetical protein